MNKIILTTPDELHTLIADAVRAFIRSLNLPHANQSSEVNTGANEPFYLDVTAAAQYLNLAKQTLYGLTSSRKIPFIKRSKKLYFLKTELDRWLQEGKKESVGQFRARLNAD